MKQLRNIVPATPLVALSAAASTAFPPYQHADVVGWNAGDYCPPEFDLEFIAASTLALTATTLYGAVQFAGTIIDDDVNTVDFANNELDITSHGLLTGDGPIQFTTATTLPTGIELATDYWVIALSAGTIKLAASLEDAFAGTAIAFTDAGTGTHTLHDTASTKLTRWLSYGLLGPAEDGAISLTKQLGHVERWRHRPGTLAYALSATFGGSVQLDVRLLPVQEY